MSKKIPDIDVSAFGAPVQKLIELNTATLTKAFEAQKAAAEKQIAQAQADFKALTEIKDVDALTTFVAAKSEEAKTNLEALKTQAQVSAEHVQDYYAQIQAILTESMELAAPDAKKPAKKS